MKAQLSLAQRIVYGKEPGWERIYHEIIAQGRWATHHRAVFRFTDAPKSVDQLWEVEWAEGSTEYEYIGPFEDIGFAEFYLVEPVQKTVTVYVKVKSAEVSE